MDSRFFWLWGSWPETDCRNLVPLNLRAEIKSGKTKIMQCGPARLAKGGAGPGGPARRRCQMDKCRGRGSRFEPNCFWRCLTSSVVNPADSSGRVLVTPPSRDCSSDVGPSPRGCESVVISIGPSHAAGFSDHGTRAVRATLKDRSLLLSFATLSIREASWATFTNQRLEPAPIGPATRLLLRRSGLGSPRGATTNRPTPPWERWVWRCV